MAKVSKNSIVFGNDSFIKNKILINLKNKEKTEMWESTTYGTFKMLEKFHFLRNISNIWKCKILKKVDNFQEVKIF